MTHIDEQLEEERMTRLMRKATRDIVVPVDKLVREGRRRGTSMRRRRRAAQLAGICVCTAAVVGGVTLARPLIASSPTPSDGAVVADQPTVRAESNATRSRFAVASADMATTLASLLPADGSTQGLRTWGSSQPSKDSGLDVAGSDQQLGSLGSGDANAFRAGSLVFDDGAGLAAVTVIVSAPDSTRPSAAADDVEALCAQGGAVCTDVAAGRLVVLENISEAAGGGTDGVISSNAVLVTPDGYSISVTAYNAAAEKDSEPTRSHPPFTGEELGSIVTDSAWLS